MADATLKVFRGNKDGGQILDFKVPIAPGMVVQDADGLAAAERTNRGDADQELSGDQRFGYGCFVELPGEQEDTAVQTEGRCGLEVLSGRCGSGSGISQVY